MKRLTPGIAAIMFFAALACACTQNSCSRSYGGSSTVKLDSGMKLVNVTWKEADLWLLQRPMESGEKPVTSVFEEVSSFGVFQGKVSIVESSK